METINDIVAEMREFADADSHSIGRDVLRRRIQHFADRIEKRLQNCNQFKMREAIDGIKNAADSALTALSIGNCQSSFLWDIVRKCDAALSAPPRNCDLYATEAGAYRGWERYYNSIDHLKDDYLDFEDWLLPKRKEKRNEDESQLTSTNLTVPSCDGE